MEPACPKCLARRALELMGECDCPGCGPDALKHAAAHLMGIEHAPHVLCVKHRLQLERIEPGGLRMQPGQRAWFRGVLGEDLRGLVRCSAIVASAPHVSVWVPHGVFCAGMAVLACVQNIGGEPASVYVAAKMARPDGRVMPLRLEPYQVEASPEYWA